jgi:hypothetical protein
MHDLDRTLESEDAFETGDAELDPEIFEVAAGGAQVPAPGLRRPRTAAAGTTRTSPSGGGGARPHAGRWIRRGRKIVLLGA